MFRIIPFLLFSYFIIGLAPMARAQAKYSIQEMTPQVKQALENRRNRYSEIEKYKKQGVIGEDNRGYVKVLESNNEAERLAKAENADRQYIYQTIANQNNLTEALETIEKIFAEVQRENADPGMKMQLENGDWVSK